MSRQHYIQLGLTDRITAVNRFNQCEFIRMSAKDVCCHPHDASAFQRDNITPNQITFVCRLDGTIDVTPAGIGDPRKYFPIGRINRVKPHVLH